MNFEMVIMVTSKNINILEISIPYIRENIRPLNIIGVGALKLKKEIEKLDIGFWDEDNIFPGLTHEKVKELIYKERGDTRRTGWYFQQFLKYAYSYISNTDYYLVWDSDTIPLNKLEYFSGINPCFIIKKEYHKAYFNTLNRLFNGNVFRVNKCISYIAENMMFNKKIVQEIISEIENNDNVRGNNYYEKILFAVDKEDFECGFSEFETYGNYVELRYPDLYQKRYVRTLRDAVIIVGCGPSREQLDWMKKGYDIISLENNRISFAWLTKNAAIRNMISARTLTKIILSIRKIKRSMQGKEIIGFD